MDRNDCFGLFYVKNEHYYSQKLFVFLIALSRKMHCFVGIKLG